MPGPDSTHEKDDFEVGTIILGFTGPIGSGCTFVAENLPKVSDTAYKYFRLSSIIEEELAKQGVKNPTIQEKQNKGNELRRIHGGYVLADRLIEMLRHDPDFDSAGLIIDGIKNVKEVQFLRQFPFFFLLSVQANNETRRERCTGEDGKFRSEVEFETADKRDELEEDDYGQQVKECNYLSDIIIFNNHQFPKTQKDDKQDFLVDIYRKYVKPIEKLAQGIQPSQSHPTSDELCMTIAYSLSKMSSCIKRKVGAVIVEKLIANGEKGENDRVTEIPFIISSGFNEVPLGSHPCILNPKYEMCYRDYLQQEHAKELKFCPKCGAEIIIALKCPYCGKKFDKFTNFCPKCLKEIEDSFKCPKCECEVFKRFLPGGKDSPGKLLDMCRALHAEENAILKLVKSGIRKENLTLFVTTQPCNLCANKIVTVGISEVVFDAPYSMRESMRILEEGGVTVRRFQGVKSSAYFKLY